jgi:hypothetical protein
MRSTPLIRCRSDATRARGAAMKWAVAVPLETAAPGTGRSDDRRHQIATNIARLPELIEQAAELEASVRGAGRSKRKSLEAEPFGRPLAVFLSVFLHKPLCFEPPRRRSNSHDLWCRQLETAKHGGSALPRSDVPCGRYGHQRFCRQASPSSLCNRNERGLSGIA